MGLMRSICTAAALTVVTAAQAAPAQELAAEPLLPSWNQFVNDLRDLAPKALEKLPPEQRNDPQIQQEVGRLLLEAIAARSLEAVGADADRPIFLPSLNLVMNIYQPNADTVYKQTPITPGGAYRLRGRKGSMRIAKLGAMGARAADGKVRASDYYDINSLPVDAEGNFDVILSPVRPQGYDGAWWKLNPDAVSLLLRQVASDWTKERDAVISIERIDAPAIRPRPAADVLQKRLKNLSASIDQTALFLIDHPEQLRKEGYVNRFKIWDVVSNYGGVFGQFYYETAYKLKDDEALIIETVYPKGCKYASLILTNDIFETTDWYNNHSSLNDSQWKVDPDGKVRIIVSAKDPGVQNWLDTAGYPSGVIQGRWMECESKPLPSVRKVAIGEVGKLLPSGTAKVTLKQREQIIRDRRAAFQQRVLW